MITASFMAAYVIVFGWPGTDEPAVHPRPDAAGDARARYLAFIPFGLYRSVWRYAGARDAVAAAVAVVVSERRRARLHGADAGHARLHRSFFIVDALICMVAIAGSRFAERTIVIGDAVGARPDRPAAR